MSSRPSGARTHRSGQVPAGSETDFVALAGRLLWRWRLEAVLVALVGAPFAWLTVRYGWPVATAVIVSAVVLLLAIGSVRRGLLAALRRSHWRRKVGRAFDAGVGSQLSGVQPRILKVRHHALGVVITLRLRRGLAATQLDGAREHFAAALRVRDVRVDRDPTDASRVDLVIVTRDPLALGVPCPWRDVGRTDAWDPAPIAVDEKGDVVSVELFESSLLLGGKPGSGKSNLLELLAARTALDPRSSVWICDPKRVELLRWAPFAVSSAGPSLSDAIRLLETLAKTLDERYARLDAAGLRKIDRQHFGLHVLLVDELPMYLSDPDRRAVARFVDVLRSICMNGRAAGVVPVLAAQKPSVDVVPSAIRDVLSWRIAFASTTRDASDTILGAGLAAQGISAADIDPTTPGVAWLLGDGSAPRRIRTFHLDDDDLDVLVERARRLRP